MNLRRIEHELQPNTEPSLKVGDNESILFFPKQIHLLWGDSLSGKTALCLYLTKQALQNNKNVLYWDTEGGLTPASEKNYVKPIIKLSKQKKGSVDYEDHIPDEKDYKQYLQNLEERIKENNIDVLIIDSILAPVVDMNSKRRASLFRTIFNIIKKITVKTNITTIVTTHVWEGKEEIGGHSVHSPIGGNAMKHITDSKIWVQRAKNSDIDSQTGKLKKSIIHQVHRGVSVQVKFLENEKILEAVK